MRGCGEEIGCRWAETSSADYSAEYLFGPIPGFVLILRGIVILHASAVACSRGAIALLGDAGAGKSSTAAAFAMRGAPVLTDDIVTLDEKEPTKGFLVHSGLPQIKLWPSSVEMLFGTPDALPRLTPNSDKCYLDLTQPGYGFQEEPLPLSAIYVLGERKDDDSAFHIEPVTGAQAMLTLVANSYCCHVLNAEQRVHEFEVFKQLIPKVPIRRVTPHGDPAKIWQLCDVIQRDFVRRLRRSTQMKAKLF